MSWKLKEILKQRLQRETGHYIYAPGSRSRMALIYPNSYFVGMSNLGFHIIYELMNERADTACERFFLPDKKELEEYQRSHTQLLSLETQSSLQAFPLLAFAISFEMDYFNVLKILELGRIQPLAAERGAMDPIIIAGGPCATFNPEPLSLFFDAFIIGEGEETMEHFMDAYYAGLEAHLDRPALLASLARVPGVYVPSLYDSQEDEQGRVLAIRKQAEAPEKVQRQWVADLDAYPAHTVVETEDTEFNLYLIETARGCGRHCRFCMAGYCFRRPRNRSLPALEKMLLAAKAAGKRVGLMGAAISDYPEIDVLCREILGDGLSMSVASFRADSVTRELVTSLAASGLRTLTMAPEAGSARMRAVINKGIEEEHLFHAMDLGIAAGIRNYRLYLMIGLPYEQPEDIQGIIDLAGRLKDYMEDRGCRGTLTLSINPFIPKPFTPFQWVPMAPLKQVEASLKAIRTALRGRRNIEIIAESPKEAYIQGVLARGSRRISAVIYEAHKLGGSKAFKRSMKAAGLQMEDYLYRQRTREEIFPWDMLDMGFSREYLYQELEKAARLQPTMKCFDGCKRCGVCR